jgi:hypothetical protein
MCMIDVYRDVRYQLLQEEASCDDSAMGTLRRTAMMSGVSRCAARRMASRSRRPAGSTPMAHHSRHALQPAGMTQYTGAGGRAGSCCKVKHPERLTSPLQCCCTQGGPWRRCCDCRSSCTAVHADAAPVHEVLPADDEQRHSGQQPGAGHQAGCLPAPRALGSPGISSRRPWRWRPLRVHVRHAAGSGLDRRLAGLLCISMLGRRVCQTSVRILPGGCHWRAPDSHLHGSVREPKRGGLQCHDAQLPSCTV